MANQPKPNGTEGGPEGIRTLIFRGSTDYSPIELRAHRTHNTGFTDNRQLQ